MEKLNKINFTSPLFRSSLIQVLGKIISQNPTLKNLVLSSRASRLNYETNQNPIGRFFNFIIRTLLEMIPFFGDFISIVEGLSGKEILGRRLDKVDRVISLVAGLIPVIPATPFRELVRSIRIEVEEATLKYS